MTMESQNNQTTAAPVQCFFCVYNIIQLDETKRQHKTLYKNTI